MSQKYRISVLNNKFPSNRCWRLTENRYLKNYRQRFALSGKPITKVGINFDSTQGNITDWVIEA